MERSYDILEFMKKHKRASIEELCAAFFCSPATVRRELAKLEHTGAVRRIRGGAILRGGNNFDYSAAYRMSVNIREKQYIWTVERVFISQGMSVFLDSSSTVEQLCPMLAEYQSLTVMTNGINNALRLNELDNIETYITGGRMESGSHTVLGEMAGQLFSGFKADVAFISCRGVASDGCFEANHQQALIKQNMMKNTKSTVLLFDSSKANKSYFYRLAEFSSLTAVITDKKPDDALADAIASSGCELLY